MAEPRHRIRILLLVVFLSPLLFYLAMIRLSRPVFSQFPFAYSLSPQGDTLYHQLPAFALQDLRGGLLTDSSLRGTVTYLAFYSVRDTVGSIVLMGNLRRFYDNIDWEAYDRVRFVLVNTGDSLSRYLPLAGRNAADPAYWIYASGDPETVRSLAGDALHLPEFQGKTASDLPVFSSQVALVDKAGRVRKYYTGTDLGQIRKMEEDFRSLLLLEYPDDIKDKQN